MLYLKRFIKKGSHKSKLQLTLGDVIIWLIILTATIFCMTLIANGQDRYVLTEAQRTAEKRIFWAEQQIGINERDNLPVVLTYLRSVGLTKRYAWCQAFQYNSFRVVCNVINIPIPIPRSGVANSSFDYAKKNGYKTDFAPAVGDLLVWKQADWSGHVALIVKIFPNKKVQTIEGNTSSLSTRQGGAVERKMRYLNHKIGKLKVRGLVGFEN